MKRAYSKLLKDPAAFSRKRLLSFALAFALIGGYVIYSSFAAPNVNLPGDLNNDNTVNVLDLSILLSDYGTSNSAADLNADSTVNILDLSILLSHWGQNYASSSPSLGPEIAAGAGLGGNQYQSDLRVDPNNPNHIIITMKTAFSETSDAAISSLDGGATWSSTVVPSSADPDVFFDNSGNAYWTFINQSPAGLGMRKSTDGGQTWSATTNIGPNVDHPQVTVDRGNSQYAGTIYAAGRTMSPGAVDVDYSRNAGATWSTTTVPLSGSLGAGFVYGLTVLQDGTVVIPMLTAHAILSQNGFYAGSTADMYVLRSTDGGQSFSSVHIQPFNGPANPGPGGFQGLANLGVGSNGSGGQRLYLAYAQEVASAPAQLMMITSDDGGLTWTSPVQIAPSLPSGWGTGPCSVMVNKNGVIGVQYYNEQTSYSPFDLYFVYSKDNGATWSTPLRISSVSSAEPANEPRVPGQDQVYSDVDSNGLFHLVWTDDRGSGANYTVYTRTVSVP